MTVFFWISAFVIGVVIWMVCARLGRGDDLGTVSAQWLQEHRRETHRDL